MRTPTAKGLAASLRTPPTPTFLPHQIISTRRNGRGETTGATCACGQSFTGTPAGVEFEFGRHRQNPVR